MGGNIIKDKSFQFAVDIVSFYTEQVNVHRDYVLSKQLLRSGISIGANVREALNAESSKDFIHKLAIAQKECDESLYWLELYRASSMIDNSSYNKLYPKAEELLRVLKSIILSTKKRIIKK